MVLTLLQDLGKWLPSYEEIALTVPMDSDTGVEYGQTREALKKYLIDRRWEGDTTFRGAYLQWAMNWPDSAWRPEDVIHNRKHPISGVKLPIIVARLPAYGEDRIYPKEQQLIDLVRDELDAHRPVVIFVRQTDTKDIQPRLAKLIREQVPLAKPFILKNTVAADRRERVIEQEVAKGTNVILSNPELVKTGLDLVFAPTLIFFEITFNLSTMMQAAGRSLRLNQTHPQCKTVYLYYEETMEETAVFLMSRKQRAAKLLNGDIGLTGLDALTEGEAGIEEALLAAIGKEETLVNPGELFKASSGQTEIDTEDAAYWNVERADLPEVLEIPVASTPSLLLLSAPIAVAPVSLEPAMEVAPVAETIPDILTALAAEFGGTVRVHLNTPALLTPTPPKAKPQRRRKLDLSRAPEDNPLPSPCPESITTLPQRVQSGLQIPLF